jgi:hypothetical protein
LLLKNEKNTSVLYNILQNVYGQGKHSCNMGCDLKMADMLQEKMLGSGFPIISSTQPNVEKVNGMVRKIIT